MMALVRALESCGATFAGSFAPFRGRGPLPQGPLPQASLKHTQKKGAEKAPFFSSLRAERYSFSAFSDR